MGWPVLICLLLAAVLVAFAAWRWVERRAVQRYLAGREALDDAAFSSLFPTELEGEIAVSARRLLASMVSVDVALIRPDDKPAVDLGLGKRDGLDANEFLASVERQWQVKVPRTIASQLETVADVACAVAQRVEHLRERRREATPFLHTLPAPKEMR